MTHNLESTIFDISSYDPSEISNGGNNNNSYSHGFLTLMNLLNTLIGAEILGIANSMTFLGLCPSVALMVCTALMSYVSTVLVIRLQNRTSAESINDMAAKLLGKWGGNLLSILTLCFTYACQVAYLVIASNSLELWLTMAGPKTAQWTTGWRRAILVFIYAMILPVALTIPKKMDFLNTASTAAIGFILFFAFAIVVKSFIYFPKYGINKTVETGVFGVHIFNALAIYAMIFALPAIVLPLLKPYSPSLHKRYFLVGAAFIICFTVILTPSALGYLMFGVDTEQVLLDNFDSKDIFMQIVRATFFLVVNASFPVVGISVITDISDLVFKTHDAASLPPKQRALCLLIADAPPVLIAMWLPEVRPALEVGGAFGGCLTNFFFPPMLWVRQSEYKWYTWSNLLLILFSIFGVISAGIATYQAFIDAFNSD